MRIALITLGSLGDVYPFVALGEGLQAAGHDVVLVTHALFEPFARSRGLDFAPVRNDPREILEDESGQAWLETGSNALRFFRQFSRIAESLLQESLIDCWNACEGVEAIVFSTIGLCVGYAIAEKLEVPFCMAAPYPLTPTRAFASPYFPPAPVWLPLSKGYYNWLTHTLSMQAFWQLVRPHVNKARREVLHLPPLSVRWLPNQVRKRRIPLLYCYSAAVLPPPRDWGYENAVTGYWFLKRQQNWQPPEKLVDFLAAGPPPVYIGFGSMRSRKVEEVTAMVLKALARAKRRGILLTGWGGLSEGNAPGDVFQIDAVPHDWLFPQMAAVVHHGGSGTTGSALRAGVPSIIIPIFGDQQFWSRRVFELGVGTRPIPRQRLSEAQLVEAIRAAASDEDMRSRAVMLGQRIQAEDGVARAVEVLQRYLVTS